MNILIAMNSKISHTSGGLERTTINLFNYLNQQEKINAYGLFNDYSNNLDFKEKLIKGVISDSVILKTIILEKSIDVILFPAGPWYAKIGSCAAKGTNCKIVTAYHSKEGYENFIFYQSYLSKFRNSFSYYDRFKNLLFLLASPILKLKNKYEMKKLMQLAYLESDAIVLLSNRFAKSFKEYYNLPNIDKIQAIGNGLSFNYFAEEQDILNKEKKILIVSRLQEAQKRLSLAIKVWKEIEEKYPEWQLEIVGEGIDEMYYKTLIKTLQLKRIKLHGRQNPESFYKKASIFIMTSAIEGWGMTITEAMQYGCVPVVIDSYESLHDIVNSQNGIIIPNDHDKSSNIQLAIENLIQNPNLRLKLASQGVQDSERFTMDKIGQKWVQLLNKINCGNKN